MDLNDRVVIVTGAGRGLGRAYVLALAEAGARVVINDADAGAANEVLAEVEAAGGKAVIGEGAVGSSDVADGLVRTAVEHYGRLDALVTNAGILRDKVVWKMSDDEFDAVLAVHMRGTFTCVRAAVLQMREQGDGGQIIVIGSPAGQVGNFGQTNYSGAKAGIIGMVRTWALELARSNIDVNAVVPVAATAMTRTIPSLAPFVAAYEDDGVPLPDELRKGRGFGVPEDVAGLIVFLAGGGAAGTTGHTFGIGGDRLSLWSQPEQTRAVYTDGGWSADKIATVWASSVGKDLAPTPQP